MREIDKLAKKLGYKLVYNKDSDCDPLYNDCMSSGDTMWIGEYDNEEYELISFFHEYGHRLIHKNCFVEKWDYNTLMIEIECWNLGIEAAREMGYLFSDDAIHWAYSKKAGSYVGHDCRECDAWEEKYKPLLWINKRKIDDK